MKGQRRVHKITREEISIGNFSKFKNKVKIFPNRLKYKMQIKWIELNGFKSFPEKTKIELNKGITCFVGPNGAGKSNIADAFRWVLGEHNPRTLRGDKMEEVIFQGSASKKEKGLAEVTLLLSLQKEPENGNEPEQEKKEIKRRLYRTGESYFIINGKQSRLKDIKELFISEGVDIRNSAIIDQIKINEILSKAYQRKALLEECAGISIYKFKKTEAEGKLQSARDNLQRLEDIVSEVKKQLILLERQAKKAEKYKKITEELKNLELKVSKNESINLLSEIEILKNEINVLENKQSLLKEDIIRNTEKINSLKKKIAEAEDSIQNYEEKLKQKELEKANNEKKLALLFQEQKNKEEQILRLKEEEEAINIEINKIKGESAVTISQIEDIEKKINNLQDEILDYEQALLDYQKKTADTEKNLDEQRKTLFNLSTELANKKNYYNSIKKSIETIENRILYLQQRIEETNKKLEYLKKEVEESSKSIKNLQEAIYKENSEIENLQKELAGIDKIKEEKSQIIIEKKKTEAIISGKIESLQAEIWQEDKKYKLFFEAIDVKPEAEELFECFLDDKLKASLIENINQIAQTENRKFYFLKNISLNETEKVNPFKVKKLSDFVTIKDSGINKGIFDKVFIVDNLKEALELKKELPDASFITMQGETLFPDGFIKTGKPESLLKKKRLFEELQEEKEKISNEVETLQEEIEKIKNFKEQIIKNLENKRVQISQISRQLIQKQERYKGVIKELEITAQRVKHMQNEEKALNEDKEQNIKLLETTKTEIEYISYSIQDAENKIEEIKKLQEEILEANREKMETLSNKRIDFSTLKERLISKKAELNRLNEQIKKLINRKQKASDEINQNKFRIAQIEKEIIENKDRILIILSEIKEITDKKQNLLSELENEKNLINQLEKDYLKLNEELQNITTFIGQKKLSSGEKTVKLENLWHEIHNRYGIDILQEDIEPAEETAPLKTRIDHLATQLKEIGPVDIEILKEYEEVKERYTFLTGQQKDLITSIEELETAIKKINSLTRKKLRETFDALKEKFNSIFKELFGGGKAELQLSDENNILEADIDINVQPPGKKSTNINLLSGGEKTLSAIAFIFACLSIRPSPLCIFDEVDAPLDDPNTLRLRKLIKDFSNKTQFLIITHNKLLMESADYIYGVTMQEEGVSTVISLGLKEAEVYA